jgi:hypothetical protein
MRRPASTAEWRAACGDSRGALEDVDPASMRPHSPCPGPKRAARLHGVSSVPSPRSVLEVDKVADGQPLVPGFGRDERGSFASHRTHKCSTSSGEIAVTTRSPTTLSRGVSGRVPRPRSNSPLEGLCRGARDLQEANQVQILAATGKDPDSQGPKPDQTSNLSGLGLDSDTWRRRSLQR